MPSDTEREAERRRRAVTAKRRRVAWIAASPEVVDHPDLVIAFIADVRGRLHSIAFDDVWANGRSFRWTETGRRKLHAAIASRKIDSINFGGGEASLESTRANITIDLTAPDEQIPTSVAIGLSLRTEIDISAQFVADLTAIVKAWVTPLSAAAAYVSDDPNDGTYQTHHEATHNLRYPYLWDAVNQQVRGIFWGAYLGPALCQILGGSVPILRAAPASIRERLGLGVWLQLAEHSPADSGAYQRLADYLSPILPRSREQQRWDPPAIQPSEPADLPPPVDPPDVPPVPIHVLDASNDGLDQTLNIVLAPPLDDGTLTAVESVMRAWFISGLQGHYGGGSLHHMSDRSIDRTEGIVRYHVDFGHADPVQAFDALLRWLGSLGEGRVQRLVIGVETVG
ncbi:MAG TPA: hypothetical protein VHV31_02715 [Nitrolancea sp.]|jgi:hypothetical protein|nr:hypothetical protein [Nitrolancea sp.]